MIARENQSNIYGRNQGFTPKLHSLSVLVFLSVLAFGCSSQDASQDAVLDSAGGSTAYDLLVTPTSPKDGNRQIDASTAIALIKSLSYPDARDRLISSLDGNDVVQSTVYTLGLEGTATVVDSSLISIREIGDELSWVTRLFPEQKVFATLRNEEMFSYSLYADSLSGVVRASTNPDSEVAGGLRLVTLRFTLPDSNLVGIEVLRDGGGLFFREKSLLDVRIAHNSSGSLDSLDYVVAMDLPFREPTAFRKILSIVDRTN